MRRFWDGDELHAHIGFSTRTGGVYHQDPDRKGEACRLVHTGEVVTGFYAAWHAYVSNCLGTDVMAHTWFVESFGDYYHAFRVEKKRLVRMADGDAYRQMRAPKDAEARREDAEALLEYLKHSRADDDGKFGRGMYRGGAFAHLLCAGRERLGKAFDPAWAAIAPTYWRILCETKDPAKAQAAAFAGLDQEKLASAWRLWIEKITK